MDDSGIAAKQDNFNCFAAMFQGWILPIETKCLDLWSLQISHRSDALTYIRHLVSIGPDNAPSVKESYQETQDL